MSSQPAPDMSRNTDDKKEEEEEEKKLDESENERVSFIEQVEIALNTAKSENKILIVLCENAEIMNGEIWNNNKIVESVKNNGVCLLIRDGTLAFQQFSVLYPVIAFPTIYCINPQNGQVLQCKYKDQITIDSVVQSISQSIHLMQQQQEQTRTHLQIREITQQNNNNNNNNNNNDNIQNAEEAPNNSLLSIQEMDMRSEDSMQSAVSTMNQTSSTPDKPKKKSVVSKLEQIREKAKKQKLKKKVNKSPNTNTSSSSSSSSSTSSPSKSQKKQKVSNKKKEGKPTPLNNYNFGEDKLDAIEYMEVTRRNKLRKRKKKMESRHNVNAASTASKRTNMSSLKTPKTDRVKDKEDDIYASTPILSAVNDKEQSPSMNIKKSRIAFRINNEMDLEHYFNSNDKLLDVMQFIINETGLSEFTLISQYPPIHIDSIYLDRKMSAQIGLFTSNDDEKSNESMYDEIQKKLQKTLYELNMVPSCRVFIKPKFKGDRRAMSDGDSNIILRIIYFIFSILKIALEYGWEGIVFILSMIWMIINIPLKLLGITKDENNDGINNNNNNNKNNIKRKSKLPALKKDPRFAGKKSNMRRLTHSEKQEDKNKWSNGNSTMYGGDAK